MAEKSKAKVAVGVFAGILNSNRMDVNNYGKLLLRRRVEENSIIPGISFKGNWELPGGGILETDAVKVPYNYAEKELEREVREEIGIDISVSSMSAMYPVFFKGPQGYDMALVTPVLEGGLIGSNASEIIWVTTEDLNQLASGFAAANKKENKDGEGLLSGWGKRMHCMGLKALSFSPNEVYATKAKKILTVLQSEW